jgi:hypothetical protein
VLIFFRKKNKKNTIGCASLIMSLQKKILAQNATVGKAWVSTIFMQQKLEIAEAEVRAGNDAMAKATQVRQ